MPNRCAVGGCDNTPNLKEGISFYSLCGRWSATGEKKKWVDFVKLKRPTDSAICSIQFVAEDFERMYSFTPGQDKPVIPRDYSIPENSGGSWSSCIRWPTTVTEKAIQQRQTTHGKSKFTDGKSKSLMAKANRLNVLAIFLPSSKYTNLVWSLFISFYSQFYSLPKTFWFRPLLKFSITTT